MVSPPHFGPLKGIFLVSTASTGQGWVLDNNLPVMISYSGYKTASGEFTFDETVDNYPISACEDKGDLIGEMLWSTKYSMWSKIGYNPDVSGVEVPLNYNGTLFWASSTGGSFGVWSDSTSDVAGSSGCTHVILRYLDTDYLENTTTIALNGDTTVYSTSINMIRVNNFQAYAGSTPLGEITIASSTGGLVSSIGAGLTRARNLQYTVPSSQTLFIKEMIFSAIHLGKDYRPTRFVVRTNYNESFDFYSTSLFYPVAAKLLENAPFGISLSIPIRIPEMSDMYVSVISVTASSENMAEGELRGYIKEN